MLIILTMFYVIEDIIINKFEKNLFFNSFDIVKKGKW